MNAPQIERRKMPQLDKDTQKEALKEALHEWLDEKFAAFGKWTLAGLMSATFTGLAYLFLTAQGWHK